MLSSLSLRCGSPRPARGSLSTCKLNDSHLERNNVVITRTATGSRSCFYKYSLDPADARTQWYKRSMVRGDDEQKKTHTVLSRRRGPIVERNSCVQTDTRLRRARHTDYETSTRYPIRTGRLAYVSVCFFAFLLSFFRPYPVDSKVLIDKCLLRACPENACSGKRTPTTRRLNQCWRRFTMREKRTLHGIFLIYVTICEFSSPVLISGYVSSDNNCVCP